MTINQRILKIKTEINEIDFIKNNDIDELLEILLQKKTESFKQTENTTTIAEDLKKFWEENLNTDKKYTTPTQEEIDLLITQV